jgi:hypothetical protein
MPRFHSTCAELIRELDLPAFVWEVLQRENIRTIDQLRAQAERLEQVEGIEPRMAQLIRQELTRAAQAEEQPAAEGPLSPWGA